MAKWFGAHYNQEVRFSSAVKCNKNKGKDPRSYNFATYEIIIIIDMATWGTKLTALTVKWTHHSDIGKLIFITKKQTIFLGEIDKSKRD